MKIKLRFENAEISSFYERGGRMGVQVNADIEQWRLKEFFFKVWNDAGDDTMRDWLNDENVKLIDGNILAQQIAELLKPEFGDRYEEIRNLIQEQVK